MLINAHEYSGPLDTITFGQEEMVKTAAWTAWELCRCNLLSCRLYFHQPAQRYAVEIVLPQRDGDFDGAREYLERLRFGDRANGVANVTFYSNIGTRDVTLLMQVSIENPVVDLYPAFGKIDGAHRQAFVLEPKLLERMPVSAPLQ